MRRTSTQNRFLHGLLRDYAKAKIAAYPALKRVSVNTEMEALKLMAKYIANISGDPRFSKILMEEHGTKTLDTASVDIFIKMFDAEFQRIWPEAAVCLRMDREWGDENHHK